LQVVNYVRIRIIRDGKPRDPHLRALQTDYQDRITHFVDLKMEERPSLGGKKGSRGAAANAAERKWLESLRSSYKILLDARGREWTSQEFAEWLGERALRGTRELTFLVGGDRGFPEPVRAQADLLMGLSRLTLTHDWACTLLLEQIYRGFTILRGYPYAK
jgi:23S rRNA (pseudouridine1915-N3)-methyltransferase